jgi:type IV pilus assembly protein PilM
MAISFSSVTEQVQRFIQSIQQKDGESVLGVDIGTSSIKIVQLTEKRGSAVLETYGEIALGPYGEAEVGQAVNPPADMVAKACTDVLGEANITARAGGIGIPLSASLISLITLPTKNNDELTTMIPIEARKYIPVPMGEVSLDWFIIPDAEAEFLSASGRTRAPNATDVLLVAIHNATLSRFDAIVKEAGLTPRFYEIEPFSMARAAYEHTTKPTMIIDFGASGTRVYIIEFGVVDVSHTINKGGQDITHALARSESIPFAEAEKRKREENVLGNDIGSSTVNYLFSEIKRVYLTYQRKEGKAISQVVLVGGGVLLQGLVDIAKKEFDAPVVLGQPFERVHTPAFIADVMTEIGPTFATAVGLALRALKR